MPMAVQCRWYRTPVGFSRGEEVVQPFTLVKSRDDRAIDLVLTPVVIFGPAPETLDSISLLTTWHPYQQLTVHRNVLWKAS